MNLQPILQGQSGHSHLVVTSPSELENQLRTLDLKTGPFIEVRFLRGNKMTTKSGLLDELAAALQFHCYFGENWDALRDSLSSMPLLSSGGLLIAVWNAHELLSKSTPEDLETFGRILHMVQKDLKQKKDLHPLHWVWQADPAHENPLRERLSKANLLGN